MKIAIACDHGAYAFKSDLSDFLGRMGHEVVDFGTFGMESCDYPDFGLPAAKSVVSGDCERAILACTNGIGMSMVANKVQGIRAALVYSHRCAEMTRKHHDSNCLCLGAGEFPVSALLDFVETWMNTEFEGGRHLRRIQKFPSCV